MPQAAGDAVDEGDQSTAPIPATCTGTFGRTFAHPALETGQALAGIDCLQAAFDEASHGYRLNAPFFQHLLGRISEIVDQNGAAVGE